MTFDLETPRMSDQEIAGWIEKRLGPRNLFNQTFARDLITEQMKKVLCWLEDRSRGAYPYESAAYAQLEDEVTEAIRR